MKNLMNKKVKVLKHNALHYKYYDLNGTIVGYRHDAFHTDKIESHWLIKFDEKERIERQDGLASCLWLEREMFEEHPSNEGIKSGTHN